MIIKNPYTEVVKNYKKTQIIKKFPELQNVECDNFVSIYKYLSHIPECFYNEQVFSLYYNWLETTEEVHHVELVKYFSDNENRLSNAIRNINQINELNIHNEDLKGNDEYNLLEVIDNSIHPNYLKLIEGVFAPLLHPIAYFSRILRNAGVEKLDVFNLVEEIQSQYPAMKIIVSSYHHIIRNSIAHGSVEYLHNEIKYNDKKSNEVLFNVDIIAMFDELLDYCNAMILALKVFFVIQNKNQYKFPVTFLIDELKAQTENKWIKVNNCLQMTIESTGTQLHIYTFVKTTDVLKVHYYMLLIANLSEALMPGYDRYFISIKSKFAYAGWYSFDGLKLAQAGSSTAEDFSPLLNAIDESGIFFHPKIKYPKFFYKIDNFFESFLIHFRILKRTLKNEYKKADIAIPNYEIHKNGFASVINANVVLTVQDDIDSYIKMHLQHIVKYVWKYGKMNTKLNYFVKLLPLGFARISVYSKLMRKRAFDNYGLEKDLICIIQFKKLNRIRCPAIFESTVEEQGLYRIEWNKKWLEQQCNL